MLVTYIAQTNSSQSGTRSDLAVFDMLLVVAWLSIAHSEDATSAQCDGDEDGWRRNASHDATARLPCSIPILDASSMSLAKLAKQCASANTPLLIRGLTTKPPWRKAMAKLSKHKEVVERFGNEEVLLSLSGHLAQGPEMESKELDAEKLQFMRENWNDNASAFHGQIVKQVARGTARPKVTLGDFAKALPRNMVPTDAYIFHNISGSSSLGDAVTPLRKMWREMVFAQLSEKERAGFKWAHKHLGNIAPDTGLLLPLTRLGLGGTGTGAPFHDHEPAFNFAFAGRKHWIVAKPHQPLALVSPTHLLNEVLPLPAFQSVIKNMNGEGSMWQCTQKAGEAVFVPRMHLHAIMNLDDALAVAIQAEDADPKARFAGLIADLGVDMTILLKEAREMGHADFADHMDQLLQGK